MNAPETIVAADIGNSTIKLAVADSNALETRAEMGVGDKSTDVISDRGADGARDCVSIDDPFITRRSFLINQEDLDHQICDWINEQAPDRSMSWWVSTVNYATSRPLRAAVLSSLGERCSPEDWREISYHDVPLRVEVEAPEKLGIDRLLGAYAASVRFGGPLVVVDAGSAVTVDLVRMSDGVSPSFAGGAILPGIRLQHSVLATGTEALRMRYSHERAVLDGTKPMTPGRNTDQAIRLGVSASVAGAIDRLYEDYSRLLGPFAAAEGTGDSTNRGDDGEQGTPQRTNSRRQGKASQDSPRLVQDSPRLVLSGGDAKAISRLLRSDHVQIPDLVCTGLLDLAVERCPNRA